MRICMYIEDFTKLVRIFLIQWNNIIYIIIPIEVLNNKKRNSF